MNAGAAAASGDVLLFLHADTSVPEAGVARHRRASRRRPVLSTADSTTGFPATTGGCAPSPRCTISAAGSRRRSMATRRCSFAARPSPTWAAFRSGWPRTSPSRRFCAPRRRPHFFPSPSSPARANSSRWASGRASRASSPFCYACALGENHPPRSSPTFADARAAPLPRTVTAAPRVSSVASFHHHSRARRSRVHHRHAVGAAATARAGPRSHRRRRRQPRRHAPHCPAAGRPCLRREAADARCK